MKPLKIAFIVWRFPMLSESFILNQIAGLLERNHDVRIYALNGAPESSIKHHPIVDRHKMRELAYLTPRFNKDDNGTDLAMRLAERAASYPKAWQKLVQAYITKSHADDAKFLNRSSMLLGLPDYDIVHCQFGNLAPAVLRLRECGMLQGKLITIFRGQDISQWVEEKGKNVYDELFDKGDYFLANCEHFRKRAISLGCPADRIRVHGSGIDLERFTFRTRTLSTGPVRIALTGRLVEKKGIEYAIRAVAALSQAGHRAELHIIGDGPLRQHLTTLTSELGAGEVIKFRGWCDQREVINILDQSHLFMAPSVTAASGDQDAPVNTLKEAMAMGLPVVATRHGGIPELVEHGVSGLLVPERDAEALEQALTKLLRRHEQWAEYGRAGRTAVERKYDIDTLNDSLVQLYQSLVDESKPLQQPEIVKAMGSMK